MVMVLRHLCRLAVAPELLIAGDLVGVRHASGFQMRRQMHRPQTALQLTNGRRLRREAIGRDFAVCKKLGLGPVRARSPRCRAVWLRRSYAQKLPSLVVPDF